MNRKIFSLPICFLTFLIVVSSCTKETKNNWDSFVNDFVESYFEQNPDQAVLIGRHEYDGQLADYSDKGIRKRIDWFKNQKELAQQFNDSNLSKAQRIEKQNLIRVVDENIFKMETVRWPYRNADYYSWVIDPSYYLANDYAPLEQRMNSYVKFLQSMQIATEQIQDNFKNEPYLSQSYIKIARIVFDGYAEFMKTDALKGFENVKDEKLWLNFNRENEKTITTINKFVKWLDVQMPSAPDSFAMGSEKYSQMLYATERINIPLSELKKIAEDDLERNLSALKIACKKFSPDKTIEECIKIVQDDKPKQSPIDEAQLQLPLLKKFLSDKNIVTIPGYTNLFVKKSTPFMSSFGAYTTNSGPYDKDMVGIYYITPPNPKWTKEERAKYIMSRNELLFTSVHEVWPGHFLQAIFINKNKSLISKNFWHYTASEGWAHYTEEMMYEEGLGNYSPDYEIAMRLWVLTRNVRFIVSIKMHTEGMTVQEATQMFLKYAYKDEAGARQEAFRGTFDPQYYSYMLGKIFLRDLKNKWVAQNSSKDLNEFHTKFLSYGNLPISLIEKDMMETN